MAAKFLSTPSARRATQPSVLIVTATAISIHALREEGDFRNQNITQPTLVISIHALREEGDPGRFRPPWCRCSISIHALREEGDM